MNIKTMINKTKTIHTDQFSIILTNREWAKDVQILVRDKETYLPLFEIILDDESGKYSTDLLEAEYESSYEESVTYIIEIINKLFKNYPGYKQLPSEIKLKIVGSELWEDCDTFNTNELRKLQKIYSVMYLICEVKN